MSHAIGRADEADARDERPTPRGDEEDRASDTDPTHGFDFCVAGNLAVVLSQHHAEPNDHEKKSRDGERELSNAKRELSEHERAEAGRGELVDEGGVAGGGGRERLDE